MPMSDEERRQLLEIESHLRQEPGLVKLSRQLGAANVYTPLRRLATATIAGGALGLTLLVAGATKQADAVVSKAQEKARLPDILSKLYNPG